MNQTLTVTIQNDMREAMKRRDMVTTDILKSLLARIANAEAVDADNYSPDTTEVSRKVLSKDDIHTLVNDEINELEHALTQLGDVQNNYGIELQSKIAILRPYTKDSR